MQKVMVLGAGLVGKAMAVDLSHDYQVTAVDRNPYLLLDLEKNNPIQTIEADLAKNQAIAGLVADQDLVVGALPGFMGYQALEAVIRAGKNAVDISFFAQDPFDLDKLAQAQDVTAVVDCGVAPGMSNIILGHHMQSMQVKRFECMVGGLPVQRSWPYEYKAPFSPVDVIEEYTRPARMVENGRIVTKPALSEAELVHLEPVGTLEAFNTDGLRTLLRLKGIPDMKERTLRYPGHCQLMRVFHESGFFATEPMLVNGTMVAPRDLTSRLLLQQWHLKEGEEEFTIMRIILAGKNDCHVYDLYDTYDAETHTSSMARTTGYTATAVARLVLEGIFTRKGICPPEYIGAESACYQQVFAMLQQRNIYFRHQEMA